MEQKEKELLLKDLCARLPYKVKCFEEGVDYPFKIIGFNESSLEFIYSDGYERKIEQVKPYLRPLSSMTEEERKEYKHLVAFSGSPDGAANFIDWLNKKMFDYRTDDEDEDKTMIEKGLALEAPEGMYNTL